MNEEQEAPQTARKPRRRRQSRGTDDLTIRYGAVLMRAEALFEGLEERGVGMTGITIRFPEEEGGPYFVVARAWTDEGASVAFHDAMTFAEAVAGVVNRAVNGSLKWKEDKYANRE